MKKVVTAKEMKKIDEDTINSYGIGPLELMENAGKGIINEIKRRFENFKNRHILIFCGKGNNGGDGLVVARLLFNLN
ncbi:uncharacterized protein METZ01_LOCUS448389, partial [marine metagenome]